MKKLGAFTGYISVLLLLVLVESVNGLVVSCGDSIATSAVIENVNVSGYNTSSALIFDTLTNSSGMIERQNLTEYTESSGGIVYQTNYTINSSEDSYTGNSSEINLSESISLALTLVAIDTSVPVIPDSSGPEGVVEDYTEEEGNLEVSLDMEAGHAIAFEYGGSEYKAKLDIVKPGYVVVRIVGGERNTIFVEETEYYDLDADQRRDLAVTLNSVSGREANLFFEEVVRPVYSPYEGVPEEEKIEEEPKKSPLIDLEEIDEKTPAFFKIIGPLLLVVGLLTYVLFKGHKKH